MASVPAAPSFPGPRPLRLSDSPALDELVRSLSASLSAAAADDLMRTGAVPVEWIRQRLDEERLGASWTAVFEAEGQERLAGVAGLRRIDPIRSSAEALLLSDGGLPALSALLDRTLKTAFYHFALHRVELRAPEGSALAEAARAGGWSEEGILRGADPTEAGFRDVLLLSMLRDGYDGYGIAFIPFARGYVHLDGGRDAVDGIGFLRPDLGLGPGPLFAAAFQQGLCDRSGTVAPPASARAPERPQRLPAEVAKAAAEIAEYLAGSRRSFTFRTRANGSLFQQKVWALLEEIPFGSTMTYEDIALRLTPGDPAAARRLTRAVGSACSANPLAIAVPCHRVIGKDNKLVGFSGGLDVKEWLLEHEMFGVR